MVIGRERRGSMRDALWNNAAMRFAVKTAPQHTTWPDMLAVWQAADDIDLFESAWTFDHFYPIMSDSTGPCLEGWITTTALAQATKRLRVGVLVTGMPYRHPAVLAKMAATLDVISGGRLELGVGAGWNQEEASAYGIDIHSSLRERFDAFDEGCEALDRPALPRDHDLPRHVRAARERPLQPQAVPAAAPADLHRRRRGAADPPFGGALRPALELPRWFDGAVHRKA